MSEEREYVIEETLRGVAVRGLVTGSKAFHFDSEAKAIAFARAAIGGKSGGGFIVTRRANGTMTRDFVQSGTHLSQDGLSQR